MNFLTKLFKKPADAGMGRSFSQSYDGVTYSMLLGSGKRMARNRAQILTKYHFMMGDPIVASALRLHVTAALGGHEASGQVVFLEANPDIKKDEAKRVAEIRADLEPLFNQCAHFMAFNAAGFGDAYARIYSQPKVGVQKITADDSVYPSLVQPFEQAGDTVGYIVTTGKSQEERLTVLQMARLKMPRMLYVPQNRALEKSIQTTLTEDNIEALPIMPSLVGGSFLDAAEESFDNLLSTLTGLVSQRILSSIDETLLTVNQNGMTKEQASKFMESLVSMLQRSKSRAEEAIKNNQPIAERIYNVMPVFSEKQLAQISQFSNVGGAASISIDDVMFHAKLLAGALGVDLSMLGFSDMLSGGLGDGGFFRTSAQAAEKSRIIRTGLMSFFDYVVDIHTFQKYGFIYEAGRRPYSINFYGSISSLESEKQATIERAAASTMTIAQLMEQLKGMGLPTPAIKQMLSKMAKIDDDLSELLANALADITPTEEEFTE